MGIAHRLTSLAHDLAAPITVSEADIREELEAHLEMRTQDNLASGMSPEQARQDAELRFGDFDRSLKACHRASMGIRLWWQRLQLALIAGLVVAVVSLGISLGRLQSQYEADVANLRRRMQAELTHAQPAAAADTRIPIKGWDWPVAHSAASEAWTSPPAELRGPWCDWSALDQ